MEALSAGRARVTGLPGREEVAGVVADGAAVRAEPLERWRAVRGVLTVNRAELGRVAARLYPGGLRIGSAELLGREEWVPSGPVPLDEVALRWDGEAVGRGG